MLLITRARCAAAHFTTVIALLGAAEAAALAYSVKAGDTLYSIARNSEMPLDALLAANPALDPGAALKVGQRLNVAQRAPSSEAAPAKLDFAAGSLQTMSAPAAASTYTVKAGDTLYSIARVSGTALDALLAVNPKLDPASALNVGQRLSIPAKLGTVSKTSSPTVRAANFSDGSWVWPLDGVITTTFFGRRNHAGVDIAAPTGQLIRAAQAGVVVESKLDTRGGWGNTIIVDHGNGITSRYSHNSENLVAIGDHVQPGQPIARVGSTGNSTGPHLDYRVYDNGVPVDPATLR